MAVKISSDIKKEIIPKSLEALLPYRLSDEIRRVGERLGRIEEIRLRSGYAASLSIGRTNVILDTVLSPKELEAFLCAICDRSLYAHSDTIRNGYITLNGGIRVGICGRAALEGDKVLGVYDVSAMNIRLPKKILRVGEPVCDILRNFAGVRGVLVYSAPGEGKTTLLRSVAAKMASGEGALRVCVIDTRGELSAFLSDEHMCIDILSGYPRALGIEIATRTMNAQLIVCDEIGDAEEARSIAAAQNCGVPFLASAHAESVSSLLMREPIRRLHEARVFGAYVGIRRKKDDFIYNITDWEEADDILQNIWSGYPSCVLNYGRKGIELP